MTQLKTHWGKHAVTLEWVKSQTLPEDMVISSAHGFCFYENGIFLVNIDTRGWDLPGGHMEPGETPEECFAREAMEEASISGPAKLIGYTLVDNREDLYRIPGKYPDIGVQAFYRMDVEKVLTFDNQFESSERILSYPEEVPEYHAGWNVIFDEILDAALEAF
jgi:8-oxo-dGTP pyrophosphatase MutT (NUDIX family)